MHAFRGGIDARRTERKFVEAACRPFARTSMPVASNCDWHLPGRRNAPLAPNDDARSGRAQEVFALAKNDRRTPLTRRFFVAAIHERRHALCRTRMLQDGRHS